MSRFISFLMSILTLTVIARAQVPQVITHQGYLADSAGQGVNATLPMALRFFADSTGGTTLLELTFSGVQVTNGAFSVGLDVSTLSFNKQFWLETEVNAEILSPRTRLTSVPYALTAMTLLGPNSEATGVGAIAGGTNNRARGDYSIVSGGGGFNLSDSNSAMGHNSTVSGGSINKALGHYSTISGGLGNNAYGTSSSVGGGESHNISTSGMFATIGGGLSNIVTDEFATISGGTENEASEYGTTIAGGVLNTASGVSATIGGGVYNVADTINTTIGGGIYNNASGANATVGGGFNNNASAPYAFVGGGSGNQANDDNATIGGGGSNEASDIYTTVSGGLNNKASDLYATVSGGQGNVASNQVATIGGGLYNGATGLYSTISGGYFNGAINHYTTIGGGGANSASGEYATVSGGYNNNARGRFSVVSGGGSDIFSDSSSALGDYSTIPGGRRNKALGNYSFAAGWRAQANHTGTFVWADSTGTSGTDFTSTAPNQFLIRASGGVGIGTNNPENTLHVMKGSAGAVTPATNAALVVENNSSCFVHIISTAANEQGVLFGDPTNSISGGVVMNPSNQIEFRAGGNSIRMTVDSDGDVGIGTVTPGNILTVKQSSATDPIADAWTTYSSRRWKTDVETLEGSLEKVSKLRGVSYKEKASGKECIGLIAEEVGAVIPEVVEYEENGVDAKSVDYARLVSVLIEAVKEQQATSKNQQAIIEQLTEEVRSLTTRFKNTDNGNLGEVR